MVTKPRFIFRPGTAASGFGPATRVPPDHATTSSRGPAGSAAVRTAPAAAHLSNDPAVRVRVAVVGGRLGGDLYTGGTRAPADSLKTRLEADVTIPTRHRAPYSMSPFHAFRSARRSSLRVVICK